MREKTTTIKQLTMSTLLRDIRQDVTWSKISRQYFGKSASWMYNKLNGIDGNGNEGEFSYSEKLQLRNALYDFAERIRNSANLIDI